MPLVREGWANYFSTACAKDAFAQMDHQTYLKLRSWARFRHPHKGMYWIARKYWHPERGSWDFAAKDGARLLRHDRTPIRRHIKVRETRSPFDGDWIYWSSRLGAHPLTPRRITFLLKQQRGKCAWCGLYFKDEDLPELDHIVPTALGGVDAYYNWQLLHRHCHDSKTASLG